MQHNRINQGEKQLKPFETASKKQQPAHILLGALFILLTLASGGSAGAISLARTAVDDTPAQTTVYLPLVNHQPAPRPLINIPYLGSAPPADPFEPAIFWFGQVTASSNSADVRLWYYDETFKIVLHIIDRRLWGDPTPTPATLEAWDAVTLLIDQDSSPGPSPTPGAYRFVAQLHQGGSSTDHQAAYSGSGAGWTAIPIPFEAEATWRGGGPNSGDDAKGWQLTWEIPFSSLGLSERPADGMEWRLALQLHDRDEAGGSPALSAQAWPQGARPNNPATWGLLHFGLPAYEKPPAEPGGSTTIRSGLDGVQVVDGHVGGHTTCGAGLADHWQAWGEANYAGYAQINIQNQWDISDYPCFSRYYVTIPLHTIPAGKTILDATLTLFLFGNAGGGIWGPPPDSFIQAATVTEAWDEQTLTWNSAPGVLENYGGTWVQPVQDAGPRPYDWDVSRALARAYQAGEPLRLALYSIDGERHTGKYFWSADITDEKSPTLQITWAD
jgi:hypothetical protein